MLYITCVYIRPPPPTPLVARRAPSRDICILIDGSAVTFALLMCIGRYYLLHKLLLYCVKRARRGRLTLYCFCCSRLLYIIIYCYRCCSAYYILCAGRRGSPPSPRLTGFYFAFLVLFPMT